MNEMTKPEPLGFIEHKPAEVWLAPIPLPDGLPPVAPFTADLLPDALRPWVMDIAHRMQCPPDFPAVAAIVCMGAVIGRQIGIYPKRRDDWLVVPNLWGAVVGRPSMMKSPAMGEARHMLTRLEKKAREKYEAEMAEYELAGEVTKIISTAKKNSAAKQAKAALAGGGNARDAARAAMLHDQGDDTPPPVRRRYVTQDPTVEKLGELLNETPRGLLVFRDELVGWMRTMEKDGHESDRSFYLETWPGNVPYTYDRIGRGTLEIGSVCLSALGGIQPGPLRAYVSQANAGGAGDDGFLQRMQLLVWPDRGDEWVNVDEWPDAEAKARVYAIFERLDRITPQIGADVPGLRFDDRAQDAFDAWRGTLERRLGRGDMPPAFEAHLGKYRSLLPSLALIFHLIDTPERGAVGSEHVARAEAWLKYLETHARRLYAQALDPGMVAAIELSKRLKDLPDLFTARDVSQKGWAGLDREAVEKAIGVLTELGHIAPRPVSTGGRPTKVYAKNPALFFAKSPDSEPSKGSKGAFEGFEGSLSGGFQEIFSDEVEL